MRKKDKYINYIKGFVGRLDLRLLLIFCGDREKRPLIIALVQGTKDACQEFLKLSRTVKVDVDCQGNKCKERMLTTLLFDKIGAINFSLGEEFEGTVQVKDV